MGYDGKWQEKFEGQDDAIERAREVSESGWTVEVMTRRFGIHRFVAGFPETEREALEARWKVPALWNGFLGVGDGGSGQKHHGSAFGGHGGGGGGHGGGGHGGGH